MRKTIVAIFCLLGAHTAWAQRAGTKAFAFLNMPTSARQLALGSSFTSSLDNDLSAAWNNAAALNPQMDKHVFASYNNFIKDINTGYFSASKTYRNIGSFSLNILYLDYGTFNGYNDAGLSTGTFKAQDQVFALAYGKRINDHFRLGVSAKYIYSIYESFVSNGLSSDLSLMYTDSVKNLNITGFARNIGFQAIPYNGSERQGLPFEMAVTISKRLEHLPFRYHLILSNLQTPDMRYTIKETGEKDENGNPKYKTMTMGDNILRHIGIGGELNLSKHFVLRFGYNHQKRKEMGQDQKRGTAGFSWGLGFKVSKFQISYGSASYFYSQNSNQFSLLFNLNDFYQSKK